MASLSLHSLLAAGACLVSSASAINAALVGTWSTKSAKVLTGSVCYYSWNRREGVGSDSILKGKGLIWGCRACTILSMIVLLNQVILGSRIRLRRMGFMRRPTTEQFGTVRWTLEVEADEDTNGEIATKPSCPQAIMQFQHGTFTENADGSLSLSPFSVDGRQLQSNPCAGDNSVYTRYNQSETMEVCYLPLKMFEPIHWCLPEIPSLHRPLHENDPSRSL